jgi:hypothetical protein
MKRILTLTLAVCLYAVSAFANIEGAWTAEADAKRPDHFYIMMTRGRNHQMGTTMRLSEFTGLTRAQIDAATSTPVQFQLRREAGNTSFEGSFRNGKGAGQLAFTPNAGYLDAIRALGVKVELKHGKSVEEEDLFMLALQDVSTAFIKSMQAEGFRESLEKYLELRIFDVTPEYIHQMRDLGYKNIDSDELVATRIHKVTPDYIRQMRAAGWNLSLDDLQASRIHGATPQFADEMGQLGYANLPFDDLVSFRIHKVTPEFIKELRTLGYDHVAADDLVAMRIHRVTPDFIRELAAAGYTKVPVEKLVEMRIHKIDARYLAKMSGNS